MSAAKAERTLRLTLFGRRYCHLCDEMLDALRSLRTRYPFEIDVIDVDADAEVEARYGELVPVLAHGETVICHYHLDVARLTAHLESFR